ncbi:MAG: hypothetical protein JO349_09800 [Candidatus Eremiobacteraeota bacterium]|nr:hypothetical protein [Candidatus Eremiobacteraeota bacterium]
MSITEKNPLQLARADSQALHQKIAASTAKHHAAIRADLESAALDAKRLGDSLKTLAEAQRADAKQHLKNASARLEQAAADAKAVNSANEHQLQKASRAMNDHARAALLELSHAVASTRSAVSKN